MKNVHHLTLSEISDGLQQKKFSAEELTRSYLATIQKYDSTIHAFLTVDAKGALVAAKEIDAKRAAGEVLDPLAGIPIAVKDVLATRGLRTTAASKILEEYIPPYDATAVAKLRSRSMVILGKTNLDEFAHGASTEYSAFGPTKNPWDVTRVAGGSSGGSAAAVAAGMCPVALGTDTGGSVRQPASFCGVVGLKPTYGRISRYGLLSMTSSTDTVGLLGTTVRDVATFLSALAGKDERDATSADVAVSSYEDALKKSKKKLRIGIPKEYVADELRADVRAVVDVAVKTFEKLGATIVEVSLPHTKYGVPVYYLLTPSEISSNLARFDGIRYGYSEISNLKSQIKNLEDVYAYSRAHGFGPEVKRRIMLGTYALSAGYYDAYYKKAAQVRTLLIQDFQKSFEEVDILLTPTTPHPAFRLGENSSDPIQMYLEDIFVTGASLAGLPALSVPCGWSSAEGVRLPVGMQLIGKAFDEATILRAAFMYEEATSWHTERPPLS